MGQSLDCWENEFLLPNCFPQKYLLAAEIIVLELLTVTHFEMYFERGLGSLLAAFPYKEQPLVCNPTQHIKAFAVGPSSFLCVSYDFMWGMCVWTSYTNFLSSVFSLLLTKKWRIALEVLHCLWKKPTVFCEHCAWSVSYKGTEEKERWNRSHGFPGLHVYSSSENFFLLCFCSSFACSTGGKGSVL